MKFPQLTYYYFKNYHKATFPMPAILKCTEIFIALKTLPVVLPPKTN